MPAEGAQLPAARRIPKLERFVSARTRKRAAVGEKATEMTSPYAR